MKFELIERWRADALRLWTIRWSIAVAGLSGLIAVWGAFEGIIPVWLFAAVGIGAPVVNVILRLMKQTPGADE